MACGGCRGGRSPRRLALNRGSAGPDGQHAGAMPIPEPAPPMPMPRSRGRRFGAKLLIVSRPFFGVEQANPRSRHFVEQPLGQIAMLAALKRSQMGHLPIGRAIDHVAASSRTAESPASDNDSPAVLPAECRAKHDRD